MSLQDHADQLSKDWQDLKANVVPLSRALDIELRDLRRRVRRLKAVLKLLKQ